MGIRAFQNLATWSCLAVCLLMGVAPAEGLVLCFGSDGHVEVSPPAAGCDECSGHTAPIEGEPDSGEAGIGAELPCCPCLDVPVMSGADVVGPESPRPSPERSAPLPAMHLTRELLAARPRTLACPGPAPPNLPSLALAQLRSVILRF